MKAFLTQEESFQRTFLLRMTFYLQGGQEGDPSVWVPLALGSMSTFKASMFFHRKTTLMTPEVNTGMISSHSTHVPTTSCLHCNRLLAYHFCSEWHCRIPQTAAKARRSSDEGGWRSVGPIPNRGPVLARGGSEVPGHGMLHVGSSALYLT